jgi:phosphoserine phosphatase RsbU/P
MKRILKLEDLTQIVSRINNSEDITSLLNSIIETTKNALNCEGCSLLLYDREEENLVFYVARGEKSDELLSLHVPKGRGIAGMVMETKESIIINSAENDPRVYREIDNYIHFTTKSIIAAPMITRGKLVGVIEGVNSLDEEKFNEEDMKIFHFLSEVAAMAIHNKQLIVSQESRIKEINGLFQVSQALKDAIDLENFMNIAGRNIAEILEAERVSFFLKSNTIGKWKLIFNKGIPVPNEEYYLDEKNSEIIQKIFKTREPLLVENTNHSEDSVSHPERYKTKSFISIPVFFREEMRGILSVTDKKNKKSFEKHDLKLLMILVSQITEVYKTMIAREEKEKYISIQRDLNIAGKIQKFSLAEIPEELQGMELAKSYVSSKEIGGDFYDFVPHSEKLFSFVIADVAGKGIPAALFMEFSKTILGAEILKTVNPSVSLKTAHELLQKKFEPLMHVEVMIVQIDIGKQTFGYASAGHNRQIYLHSKTEEIELLKAKGVPLGSKLKISEFQLVERPYKKGDLVVLYTDGITECINSNREMFGEDRLISIIKEESKSIPEKIKNRIISEVDAFREHIELPDDYTLLIIRL